MYAPIHPSKKLFSAGTEVMINDVGACNMLSYYLYISGEKHIPTARVTDPDPVFKIRSDQGLVFKIGSDPDQEIYVESGVYFFLLIIWTFMLEEIIRCIIFGPN